jgi:hypothetical protein
MITKTLQQQQIGLPTLQPFYHKDTGQQGVVRKSDTTFPPALHLQHASKLAQQTLAAAHVCTTATGRTFIADKPSKRQFLNDTGSYFCVFPHKLNPQRRSRIHSDL